jgi:glycosyltransferase involved in cell wall biosynthesis
VTSVGILVDQLYAPAPGGMGTYVRELVPALRLADPGLELTLFHSRFEDAAEPPEPWMAGFASVEVPASIRRLYPEWAAARRPALPEALGSLDVIHSPLPAAVPPVRAGQTLVVTVHDVAFLVHPRVFPSRWRAMYRAGLRRIVRSADAVIAVSRHTAEDLVRHRRVDAGRIHVVPLAASLPKTGSDVGQTLARLKVHGPYLLFVGTLEPRKNVVRLVRAYRRLAARGMPHSLVLAGPLGWGARPLLDELAQEGPGEVVLTGATTALDLDALYRGAAVFVYPSLYEGFGLPVLEAMARGTPCVVSSTSSLPEVAGEAAVPVDPRSTGALVEAVERVLGDERLAARLRDAGLARAAAFSWEETARRTLEVYKRTRS